jgi:putative ABC transport system permease protein
MRDWKRGLPPDVVEEISQHVADVRRTAQLQGKSDEEIERLLEAELRNVDRLAAAIQARRSGSSAPPPLRAPIWAGLLRDVRHAIRLFGAKRGYAAVLVLTLALGIAGCTAVFSLVSSLLLGSLPFPEPDRLVLLWETPAGNADRRFVVSAPNYRDWVAETRSFEAMALWEPQTFNLAADAEPARVSGMRVSASIFEVLRITPALGRTFTREEETAGHDVAVISDAIWRAHFAADPGVLGRTLRLNGRQHEVIGVLPAGVDFPDAGSGVWVPVAVRDEEARGWHSFMVAGRLAPGVTFERAKDEIERLGAAMRTRYSENANEGATIERLSSFGLAHIERILTVLSGAVALVLLIALVNAASLQLAFGLSRRREFMTRLSLGARYGHIVRQVIVESLVVGAVACLVGLFLAWAVVRSTDAIMASRFRSLPFRGEVTVMLDVTVLAFAAVISLVSALLFGFAPLAGLRTTAIQPLLRAHERGSTRAGDGLRRALVTIEVALAIVVLCGAGLLVRSLTTLLGVDPGFNPRGLLTMAVSLPQAAPFGEPERPAFCEALARETSAIPGVISASAVSHLPLNGSNSDRLLSLEGRPDPSPSEQPFFADHRVVCGGYFATLGIPILAGRDFTALDVIDGEQVVVVNRAFAEQYYPEQDVLNRRIKFGRATGAAPWLRVVGVVENVRHFGLDFAPTREIYRPYSQSAWPTLTVVSRTVGDALALQRPVRDALMRIESELPAGPARTMDEIIDRSIAWRETPMRLLSAFAAVGLVLAALGVYGVLAYYVSQRTREFGVRVALGASKGALVALVLKQSALPIIGGIGLGVLGSVASGRMLAGLLYDVQPGDPVVMSVIVALLAAVAFIAGWLPARRAATVDPLTALREE